MSVPMPAYTCVCPRAMRSLCLSPWQCMSVEIYAGEVGLFVEQIFQKGTVSYLYVYACMYTVGKPEALLLSLLCTIFQLHMYMANTSVFCCV